MKPMPVRAALLAVAALSLPTLMNQGPAVAAPDTWSPAANLATARSGQTATTLANGKVLVTGGFAAEGAYLQTAELFDPATNTWSAAGSMATPRSSHTATLLPSGKVLVTGGRGYDNPNLASAELYDPAANAWSAAGNMATGRRLSTATLLPNGKVLVAGGDRYLAGSLSSAEVYDPAANGWLAAGSMATAREQHQATLLPSGKVLVAGGWGGGYLASSELYDPVSNVWSAAAGMIAARYAPTATLLPNGKVLVTGGAGDGGYLASAELYDPAANAWSAAGNMAIGRNRHTATLLPNGKVLVAGGSYGNGFLATAELYDPTASTWSMAASMAADRGYHAATLLPSGKVLVAGGNGGANYPQPSLASVEVYGQEATPPPPPLSHRKVIFIQGINSYSDCGSNFYENVAWLKDYITNQNGQAPELASLGIRPADVVYYSYRMPHLGEPKPPCANPGGPNPDIPGYENDATCWSIDDVRDRQGRLFRGQAKYLGELVSSLVEDDPDVVIDFIGHSQGGVVATYYALKEARLSHYDNLGSVVTFDSPFGVPEIIADGQSFRQIVSAWINGACDIRSAPEFDESRNHGFDSWKDFESGDPVVREIQQPSGVPPVSMYNIHAVPGTACPFPGDIDVVEDPTAIGTPPSQVWIGGIARVDWATSDLVVSADGHTQFWKNEQCDGSSLPAAERDKILRFVSCALQGFACDDIGATSLPGNTLQDIDFSVGPRGSDGSPGSTLDVTIESIPSAQLSKCLLGPGGSLSCSGSQQLGTQSIADVSTAGAPEIEEGPGYVRWHVDSPDVGLWTLRIENLDSTSTDVGFSWGIGYTPVVDPDGDGIDTAGDNCPDVPNVGQSDTEGDTAGDACDVDDDNDNVADLVDNCPLTPNTDQQDTDADGFGDACDDDGDNDFLTDSFETNTGTFVSGVDTGTDPSDPDTDDDGLIDGYETAVGTDPNISDSDADTVVDGSDNCLLVANSTQLNTDSAPLTTSGAPSDTTRPTDDTLGDACDLDDDSDGISDDVETAGAPCPSATDTTDPLVQDTDGDRIIDGAECALGSDPADGGSKPPVIYAVAVDGDRDGLPDSLELVLGTSTSLLDENGDGRKDGFDSDLDGMGDGLEYRGYGSSPLAVDTDLDGCADGREIASVNTDVFVSSGDQGLIASLFNRRDRPVQDVNKDGIINSGDLGLVASVYNSGLC